MSNTAKSAEAVKTAKAPAAAKKPEAVMYVGPTLRSIATYGTVYTRIPDQAKEAAKKTPLLLNLFIPIREYGDAEAQINGKQGYIYEAWKAAWALREKKKEA